VLVVLLSPVAEELFFRGVLLPHVRRVFGKREERQRCCILRVRECRSACRFAHHRGSLVGLDVKGCLPPAREWTMGDTGSDRRK